MVLPFPITPPQAAKMLLQMLPAKRMREVLECRFGLKGGERQTLEEIGKKYKITRERVRQIEADALRRLHGPEAGDLGNFFQPIEAEIQAQGGVMAEHHLFLTASPGRFHPHLRFLLTAAPQFRFLPETEIYHGRWTTNPVAAAKAEELLRFTVARLSERGQPVTKEVLSGLLSPDDGAASERVQAAADAHLQISKLIHKNPYGDYGLVSWPTISPRGIKDKAYAVLAKSGQPMHFRDVAAAIDRVGWGNKKKAHPQTVHNELIKDNRFVLVGRGLYALREWGYEPGTVREVLVSLFKGSDRPLAREEIVRLAAEKRLVKPQTILLNLQDRSLFKRTEDGKYTLV